MTPPAVLLLALLALLSPRLDAAARVPIYFWLLVPWVFVPLLRVAALPTRFYDANRHFLEYTPGVCILAGFGAQFAWDQLSRRFGPLGKQLAVGGAAIGLASLVLTWIVYRPFETTYFNFMTGGLGGAERSALLWVDPPNDWRARRSESDYWYSSIADGLKVAAQAMETTPGTLGGCGPSTQQIGMQWSAAPGTALPAIVDWRNADYVYAVPCGYCHWKDIRQLEGTRPILHREERGGGLIYEVLGPRSAAPQTVVSPPSRYDTLED
jgi:hypothetical protein